MDALPRERPVVYVDFAGDRVLRARLHRRFADGMRHSLAVGSSHWDAERSSGSAEPLPGAAPTFFFAPAQIRKRTADWGADGFQQRFAAAWHAFADRVADRERPWMTVVVESGPDAVERLYRQLLDGRARPEEGRIVSMAA